MLVFSCATLGVGAEAGIRTASKAVRAKAAIPVETVMNLRDIV